jgi:3-methyl-2-oxobutanoate hydroxymethyltransferase
MLLLEAVPPEVGKFITERLDIPVYGIGAGPFTNGQLIIVSDLIGQFQAFTPKFVKKYANVAEIVTNAIKSYCAEVRAGQFPQDEHCYHMLEGEHEKFLEMIRDYPLKKASK